MEEVGSNKDMITTTISVAMAHPSDSLSLELLPISLIWILISPLGALGNCLLILIVWREKFLRSPSHYLLQQKAVANLLSCIFFSAYGVRGLLAVWIPQILPATSNCCVLEIGLHIACLAVNTVLMLAIAIDRLIGICWPIWYRQMPKLVYHIFVTVAWLSGISHVAVALLYSDSHQLVPICFPPTAFVGNSLNLWSNWALIINVIVILIYSVTIYNSRLGGVAKRMVNCSNDTFPLAPHTNNNNNLGRTRSSRKHLRALRSLTVIVFVYIFTWVTTMVIIKLLSVAAVNGHIQLVGCVYVGGLAMADAASDFPILVWRSKDYRKALLKLLRIPHLHRDLSQTERTDRKSSPGTGECLSDRRLSQCLTADLYSRGTRD